jgi:hypothetical protein
MTDAPEVFVPATTFVHFNSFDDLLAGVQGHPLRDDEATDFAFKRGRTLLQAPPGSGKSTALRRLVSERTSATATHSIPSLVAAWKARDERGGVRRFIAQQTEGREGEQFLLCLDGLDEVSLAEAQRFLDGAELATQDNPQLSIVITDRINRRPVRAERWSLMGIAPHGDRSATDWSTLPFFRTNHANGTVGKAAAIGTIAEELTDGNTHRDFNRIASEALAWFQQEDSTAAPRTTVKERFGEELFDRLVREGLLRQNESVAQFSHILLHAYFAASAVQIESVAWNEATWSALTLGGANYSALGLLLAQVADEQVDDMMRSVDRWSYLASASLLADDSLAGRRVSPALRAALMLLLGYRRFSMSPSTDILAGDLLRVQHDDQLADNVLAATSRHELVQIANRLPDHGSWWKTWLSVFTNASGARNADQISNSDYILAWTAANVLADKQIDSFEEEAALIQLGQTDPLAEVRWRAVHAVGGSKRQASAEAALGIFANDSDEWVRYGALRSFVQIVARLDEVEIRVALLDELAKMAKELQTNPRWLREIERATQLEIVPEDWASSLGRVVESLLMTGSSLEDEDRWRSASATLRTKWQPNLPAALRPMAEGERI